VSSKNTAAAQEAVVLCFQVCHYEYCCASKASKLSSKHSAAPQQAVLLSKCHFGRHVRVRAREWIAGFNYSVYLLYWYKSTCFQILGGCHFRVGAREWIAGFYNSSYLLYWYESTNTDTDAGQLDDAQQKLVSVFVLLYLLVKQVNLIVKNCRMTSTSETLCCLGWVSSS
jgi:hypothetical protein